MPLGPLLRSQYVDLASDGFLLIGRTNAVPNPCAAVDVSTWVDESYPVETVDRVTSIPGVTLPAGAPACIHNGPTAGGSSLMMDFAPLPVAPGEWLWVQFQAFCSGGDPADYAFWANIEFNAADGTFVDWLALCEDIEPPSTGFVRYGFAVQVPENAATYSLYFTNDNRSSEEPFQLADLAEPFITQVLVEPGMEGVEPPPYVDATTPTLTVDNYVDLRSDGGILSPEQLRAIADVSQTYARDTADITDRQNVQLHWVRIEDVTAIWQRLEGVGLTTNEACGDTPRVVLGSPVAGVAADEILAEIEARGPLTAAALADDTERARDHWGWNWSDAKHVLEHLFSTGTVAVAGRTASFERCLLYTSPSPRDS